MVEVGGKSGLDSAAFSAVRIRGLQQLEPSCKPKGRILKPPRKTADPGNGAIHKKHGQRLVPLTLLMS